MKDIKFKWSIISVICGFISTTFYFSGSRYSISVPIFLLSVLAVVLGVIGIKKQESKVLSAVGILLGSISIGISYLVFMASGYQ